MYCPRCGSPNDDAARFCSNCGLDLVEYSQQWQGSPQSPRGRGETSYGPGPEYQAFPYQQTGAHGTVPHVPTYLGWAIAVLLLCFWPTGIVALVYACQVNSKLARGDVAGAQESSRKAKMWCWISFGIALAGLLLTILVWGFGAAALLVI